MLVAYTRTIWDMYCMSFLDPSIKGRLLRVRRIRLLLASVRRRVRIIMVQLQIVPADHLDSVLILETDLIKPIYQAVVNNAASSRLALFVPSLVARAGDVRGA